MARFLARIVTAVPTAAQAAPRHVARQTTAAAIFALAGFGLLLGLDALPRLGLWGDFAFALVVASLAVWGAAFLTAWLADKRLEARQALGQASSLSAQALWAGLLLITFPVGVIRWLGIVKVKLWQAPGWAALLLVGVPLAVITRWWGVGVVVGVFFGSLIVLRTWEKQWVLALWLAFSTLAAIVVTEATSGFWLWPVVGGAALILFPLTARGWLNRVPRASVSWLSALLAALAAVAFAQARVALVDTAGGPGQPRTETASNAGALAWRFRPWLFFDGDEQFAPLDIDNAIRKEKMLRCRATLAAPDCQTIKGPEDFVADVDARLDFLEIKSDAFGPRDWAGGRPSAYYYRVSVDRQTGIYYIDYWWYFAQNPNPIGKLVFCGSGLKWEVTCFDHEADWEGVVVTLKSCRTASAACQISGDTRLRVSGVGYAEHRGVKHIRWAVLQRLWARWAWDSEHKQWIASGSQVPSFTTDGRPLVFVALDSHASYPTPCAQACGKESHYNGRTFWWDNDRCNQKKAVTKSGPCLQPLPVDAKTGQASSWNAFPGPWGYQRCILFGAYCDRAAAPHSPSFQRRYLDPSG